MILLYFGFFIILFLFVLALVASLPFSIVVCKLLFYINLFEFETRLNEFTQTSVKKISAIRFKPLSVVLKKCKTETKKFRKRRKTFNCQLLSGQINNQQKNNKNYKN